MSRKKPQPPLDKKRIEELAGQFCSLEEIAADQCCSVARLKRECNRLIHRGICLGKIKLIQKQWEGIEAGNITILIWFGKVYLGQNDKNEIKPNEEEYNGMLGRTYKAMVQFSGAGRAPSDYRTLQTRPETV